MQLPVPLERIRDGDNTLQKQNDNKDTFPYFSVTFADCHFVFDIDNIYIVHFPEYSNHNDSVPKITTKGLYMFDPKKNSAVASCGFSLIYVD